MPAYLLVPPRSAKTTTPVPRLDAADHEPSGIVRVGCATDDASPDAGPWFVALGRTLLAGDDARRAELAFEDAIAAFLARGDRRAAAHAELGLAEALLAQHDPRARIVLEDAGAVFEQLGDAEAVAEVELALRDAEARFEACPRSFATAFATPRRASR